MNALDLIKKHEGLRLRPYKCSAGKWTIGYGRNIEDNGISMEEAEHLLWNDVQRVVGELSRSLPFFCDLSVSRQAVLIDMCFNLGLARFKQFRKMLAAIETEQYDLVATEMLDSKWATQVGQRAIDLAEMMRVGQ